MKLGLTFILYLEWNEFEDRIISASIKRIICAQWLVYSCIRNVNLKHGRPGIVGFVCSVRAKSFSPFLAQPTNFHFKYLF